MNDKLEILCKQMNLTEEEKKQLDGGVLERIVGNRAHDEYRFYIHLDHTLPVNFYLSFQKKLEASFPTCRTVSATFQIKHVSADLFASYYRAFLENMKEENPLLELLLDAKVSYDDEWVTLILSNKAEEMKFRSIEDRFRQELKKAGYGNVTFEIKVDEEQSLEMQREIEKKLIEEVQKVEATPIQPPVIEEPKKHNFQKGNYKRKTILDESNPDVVIGRTIDTDPIHIHDIIGEMNNVTIEGTIFGVDVRDTRTELKIVTLKVTDYTDSIYVKLFLHDEEEANLVLPKLKNGKFYLFRGNTKDDQYSKELTFTARDILLLDKKLEERMDQAPKKRVELHAHTKMSQMDGVVDAKDLVKTAHKWGHKAIAITDHNGAQAFPDVYHLICDINKNLKEGEEPFKAIYGTELTMIDDEVNIVVRPNDSVLLDNTYVVFDFETTGFNAGGGDSIIEIGAVKLHNGEIIERYDELINPGRKLPQKIIDVTSITDEMLQDKDNEENAIKRFIEWFGDLPMVAHNAKFDVSFLEMAYQKYNLGTFKNPVIDTLELSRTLDNTFARHSLSALVKRYNVPWDESSHHRGDYDAEGTALVFHKMMRKLSDRNLEKMTDLDKLVSKDEIHKYGRPYHINILCKNKTGLKNLFKIISLANTKYLYKTPRILRSEIQRLREGLLIGSGCYESEIFTQARSKSEEELSNMIHFYDYVEVQPPECYDHLLQMNDFANKQELIDNIKKIINTTKEAGKLIVATGDVHHLNRGDKLYREIIVNQKVPGGGRHPLARNNIREIPSQHFRTTDEMLEDFNFLDDNLREEIVITNPNKIADMVDIIEVIIETGGIPFSPKIENSVETVKELVYGKAHEIYGDPLPDLIADRIEQELKGIIGGGFDVIYLIAQKLVKHSNDDGYLVGSRGSVGSSFVATMMGITEVNPLPAHYVCPKCKYSIFEENGETLGSKYSSGFDLPNRSCPKCGTMMNKDGQDMPFATFLGFNADKVPDIDLNFSGDYQWKAHEYTKVLFGVDNVYRAGTIGTVADKTAFGFVKGYCEDKGINMRTAEVERIALGCTGVKRTTGQHPGGIVVIPGYMDVFDFTPFQYPADDPTSLWRTTHFDYHAIDQDVLKLDILGHVDPTHLRMLQDLSGMDVTKVPLDDKETMAIFCGPEPLGVTAEQINCPTGTLGIPEFGTKFTIQMLVDTKPTTFSELIKISGLSHGTDVWLGNAQELIRNNVVPFKEVIGCRDDIMVYLMYNGMEPKKAFKIMEFVRKGKASKQPEQWQEFKKEMEVAGIESWFIESCGKIKYMFPKAHAAAYVISAFRVAYFKVHHPLWYYCSYFSVRVDDFDIETMIKGYDAIKDKIVELEAKGKEATNKETNIIETLKIALEATARGIKFAPLSVTESGAKNFVIKDDHTLIPPFRTIDGLGLTVAEKIVEEREKNAFLSIEDLQKRGKVSATLIDKMRMMGMLDNMDESSQLSLF